jgi:hypothetical protein
MRKGWAPGTTALKSFLKSTHSSPLSVHSFLVNNVFNVPVLKLLASNQTGMTSSTISIVAKMYQTSSKRVAKPEKTITRAGFGDAVGI